MPNSFERMSAVEAIEFEKEYSEWLESVDHEIIVEEINLELLELANA